MQSTREKILNSLQPVLRSGQHVRILPEGVETLAEELQNAPIPPWNNDLQFLGTPEETAQYYFFLDSINFCFWAPKGKQRWTYTVGGERVAGYYAFSAAIKDAFIRDKRLFDASYLAELPKEEFSAIFAKGEHKLLLLDERHRIIRENFSILRDKFSGSALRLITAAGRDVDIFVATLLENFSSFRDEVEINGDAVYFLKRAQIFPSDLSFALPDFAPMQFQNMSHLTVFADYKLPQILEAFGVLEYSPELLEDIVEEHLIPAGSQKEIEIRAHTIAAVEQIAEILRQKRADLSVHEVDWILWVKAKQSTLPRPHHKTITTFY